MRCQQAYNNFWWTWSSNDPQKIINQLSYNLSLFHSLFSCMLLQTWLRLVTQKGVHKHTQKGSNNQLTYLINKKIRWCVEIWGVSGVKLVSEGMCVSVAKHVKPKLNNQGCGGHEETWKREHSLGEPFYALSSSNFSGAASCSDNPLRLLQDKNKAAQEAIWVGCHNIKRAEDSLAWFWLKG